MKNEKANLPPYKNRLLPSRGTGGSGGGVIVHICFLLIVAVGEAYGIGDEFHPQCHLVNLQGSRMAMSPPCEPSPMT